jgi:hypothetical protein
MSTHNESVLCCPIAIWRDGDSTKWERGTALGARPAPRTVCVHFWCHPLLCLSSIVPSYKIPYAKGAIYLPSLNFTMFKAPSSDPVYCFPFSRRQGTPRPSAKTYMQAHDENKLLAYLWIVISTDIIDKYYTMCSGSL